MTKIEKKLFKTQDFQQLWACGMVRKEIFYPFLNMLTCFLEEDRKVCRKSVYFVLIN